MTSNEGRWRLMTLFKILVYFLVIIKAFFTSSNAPAYTLSTNSKHFTYLRQCKLINGGRCNGGRNGGSR